jgi:hypothetical protein
MDQTDRAVREQALALALLEHAKRMAQLGPQDREAHRRMFTEDVVDAGGCYREVGALEECWEGDFDGFIAYLERACAEACDQAFAELAAASSPDSDRSRVECAFEALGAHGIRATVFLADPAEDRRVDAEGFFALEAERPARLRQAAREGARRGWAYLDPDDLAWAPSRRSVIVRFGAIREADGVFVRARVMEALKAEGLTVHDEGSFLRLVELDWLVGG